VRGQSPRAGRMATQGKKRCLRKASFKVVPLGLSGQFSFPGCGGGEARGIRTSGLKSANEFGGFKRKKTASSRFRAGERGNGGLSVQTEEPTINSENRGQ